MRGDGEDFQDQVRQDAHDEATQSSIAALDAEEACLEDTIRAGIVADLRAVRLTNLAPVTDQWTKGYRLGLERAEKIASGATL